MNLTGKLQAALWRRYSDPDYPAEWDGRVYGGGKLSQRFWEYHAAIELLELTPDAVVLDIGGGSPVTGAGFFTQLIAPHVREVHVMDSNIGESKTASSTVKFHRSLANRETLSKLLKENPQITHAASISVWEHIPPDVRRSVILAVNECFAGDIFVNTLEYHPRDCFFEHQLTVKTLSELFEPLTNFYPDEIRKSPVLGEIAYQNVSLGQRLLRKFGSLAPWSHKEPGVPLWYPLALRFRRVTV